MSEHRRPTIAFSDAPRGRCRWCGEEILHRSGAQKGEVNRRRRWHERCVEIYNRSDPREARRLVRKRDRCICAECHLDTRALKRELRGRGSAQRLRERGFVPRRSLWELDHIVPLIDGGGHEIENLQTLCTPCHKQKTTREARERAKREVAPGRESCTRENSTDRCEAGAPEVEANSRTARGQRSKARAEAAGSPEKPRRKRKKGRRRRDEADPKAADLDALLEEATRTNDRVRRELSKLKENPAP